MDDRSIRPILIAAAVALAALAAPGADSAERTVGALQNDAGAFEGYTLFAPMQSTTTFLIDNQGLLVNTWPSAYLPGMSGYLLEDGSLLRAGNVGGDFFASGGRGGVVERIGWEGSLLWTYTYSSADHRAHHDIEPLPNGNVLILAWEHKSVAQAVAAGRDPASMNQGALWPEHIIEVAPTGPATGEIVWAWHVWDHLVQDHDAAQDNFGVVADHPELIDVNHTHNALADWLHCNSLDYRADLDQILISCPRFNEVWIIDHSTTTAEAAGHTGGAQGRGGDLLYRWGNQATWRAGTAADQKLFNQHQTEWIPEGLPGAGNILIFNNGLERPEGNYTTIEEITPPLNATDGYDLAPGAAFGPTTAAWTYAADPPSSFFAGILSGAQRLPNGNTLINDGPTGLFFEIDAIDAVRWRYQCPVGFNGPLVQGDPPTGPTPVFRAIRYATAYAGFVGRDLTPDGTIEIDNCPADTDCNGSIDVDDIVTVVLAFGDCSGLCPGDVTRDGVVNIDDIVDVILGFGNCP